MASEVTHVIRGVIRNLKSEFTTIDAFNSEELQRNSALAGTVAAAAGLSGLAAGMTSLSMENARESAFSLNFSINEAPVHAIVWANPFEDGDEVEIVAERVDDHWRAFAILRPRDRIISLFPHVVSGHRAHVKTTIKVFLKFMIFVAVLGLFLFLFVWMLVADEVRTWDVLIYILQSFLVVFAIFGLIAWSVSRKYRKFVEMAEGIFSSLGWTNVSDLNLREKTMENVRPDDPPALGSFYFRY